MAKKIVFLIGYFPLAHGGAELQSFQIASFLNTENDVYFISVSDSVQEVTCKKENGFTIWLIPKRPLSRRIFRHNEFINYYTIKKILKRIKPDVVYQRCAGFNTWTVSRLKKQMNFRFVYHCANDLELHTVEDKSLRRPIFELEHRLFKSAIAQADKLFVQNSYQCQGFKKLYPNKDIEQVYNFSYAPDNCIRKDKSSILIMWVANIKPKKNPDAFLRIVQQFKNNSSVQFYMVGIPSNDMENIYSLDKQQENFHYLGYQPNATVNEMLAKSHLVINTSYIEGFSNVFLQAWFRGCPVISLYSDPDGLIKTKDLGFYADGKEERIIEFLENYITNSNMRIQYMDKVRDFAYNNLSADVLLPIIKKGILGNE